MDISYIITPFVAWLVAGSIKFTINSIRAKQLAFGQIGYGGLPSNHSAIVSSMGALIALREGVANPAFGVAVTLAFIVILDASSLRRQIGKQAAVINRIAKEQGNSESLRERMGHSRAEIFTGIVTGVVTAWIINQLID